MNQGIPLGACGELIAQVLVAWATSFGFDESGEDSAPSDVEKEGADSPLRTAEGRRNVTTQMITEILAAIDRNSVTRIATWDGVRLVFLLVPLTEGILSVVDREVRWLYHRFK